MQSKAPLLKQAWDKFHASQETVRQEIESTSLFDNPVHRAQAYYALIEAQAMAYNWVVAPRLNHPRIFTHTTWSSYLYSIGGNNPDFVYGMLGVDGRYTYRVRGRHGDVRLLLMQVLSRPMGVEGSRCTGNFEFAKSDTGDDLIDIILSPTEQKGNWIPLDPTSDFNMVIIRRLMLDWDDDPGELEVEMIGELEGYDELSETAMARRIEMGADFNLAAIRNWVIGFKDYVVKLGGGHLNTWGIVPGEQFSFMSGSSTCNYGFLPYELESDESIIIEMEIPPDSAYWSFQLVDMWCRALDFMHAQTDLNMKHVAIDADNKVRLVISFSDPGVANWLDPMGRLQGVCALRNYRSASFSVPTARIVKFSELDKHLPADTKRVTPEERRKAVERRRPAILRLYRG